MRQSLWVPGPLPGMNEIVDAAKGFGGRGYGYSKMKRVWTDTVHLLAKAANMAPVKRVRLTFAWTEKARRRDPDNFTGGGRKFVIDGLVAAGVLPGDGWGVVTAFQDTWSVSDRPGVLVVLEDAAL